MTKLFEPLIIRDLAIRNRIWVSPMCQYSASDGVVGNWHLMHLGSLASGGAGLVIAEATGVTPEGRISIGCPGLWNEEQVAAWRVITDFVHTQGTNIGVQLAHAGRKASTMRPGDDHLMASPEEGGWTAQAPSALAFEGYPVPHELSVSEITQIIESFAQAALNAIAAGFDVLEIHAAHGYLAHQFLSPLSNTRSDAYGGSFENRTRFLLEVVNAVRSVMPAGMPLFTRISATDYVEGGWDLEQSIALAKVLSEAGCDLIDVSSGGNVSGVRIQLEPGYQVPFAETIRREASVLTSAVGLITEAQHAEEIVSQGQADAVMVARAVMRNPRWPLLVAEELGEIIEWPIQLDRARTLR